MKLDQLEFDVLVYIEAHQEEENQCEKMSRIYYTAVDEINNKIKKLEELNYIVWNDKGYKVTETGYDFLKPHRVKRAVLIAAGTGSRMNPVTLTVPKPLVKINGKPIIETLLDALLEKGIDDITIVRGYLGEQFDSLKEKYPCIKFRTNNKYLTENNISSGLLVKELYKQAYVMDADLYLNNHDIIRKYECYSSYLGVPVKKTNDWRLIIKDEHVTGMKVGGNDCYQMIGLSYWTKQDGESFEKDIERVYGQPGAKELYWDDVVLGEDNSHYDIKVRKCSSKDVTEFDTVDDLKAVDSSYANIASPE